MRKAGFFPSYVQPARSGIDGLSTDVNGHFLQKPAHAGSIDGPATAAAADAGGAAASAPGTTLGSVAPSGAPRSMGTSAISPPGPTLAGLATCDSCGGTSTPKATSVMTQTDAMKPITLGVRARAFAASSHTPLTAYTTHCVKKIRAAYGKKMSSGTRRTMKWSGARTKSSTLGPLLGGAA